MAGKSLIGALRVTLGLDSAQFSQGVAKSKKELTNFQKGLGMLKTALVGLIGVEAIQQFREMGRAALDSVGGLGEAAAQLGVTTDALQEFRFIAVQTGQSQEDLDLALGQLTKRLGAAADGAKKPSAALKELGVNLKDAKGNVRATDQVLLDIAGGLEKIESPAQRAAIATDLFGKSGQKMLPFLEEGKAKLKGYIDEAYRLGVVIDEATIANSDKIADDLAKQDKVLEMRMNSLLARRSESLAKLETWWQDIKIGAVDVGAALIDAASGLDAWLVSWDETNAKFWKATGQAIEYVMTLVPRAVGSVVGMGQRLGEGFVRMTSAALNAVKRLVVGVKDWLGTQLNTVFDGVKKRVEAVGTWFYDLYDKVVGHSYIPDMVDEIGQHMARLDAELVKPTVKATTKAAEAFRALQQEASSILSRLFPEMAELNEFEREKKKLNEYFDAAKKGSKDVLALEQQRAAALEALSRAYLGLNRDVAGALAGDSTTDIELVTGGKTIEEINDEIDDRFADTMGKLKNQADVAKVKIVESFSQMVDGALRQLDRFIGGIKSGNWLDIIGGLLGAIDGIAATLTGGKGFNLGPLVFGNGSGSSGSIPGFASGGSMTLGGFRGIDRNLLSLNGQPIARVSENENLSISPANDRGGRATNVFDLRGAVVTEDLLRQMNQLADGRIAYHAPSIVRGAAATAIGQLRRQAGRSLG